MIFSQANWFLSKGSLPRIRFRWWHLLADVAVVVLFLAGLHTWGLSYPFVANTILVVYTAIVAFTDFGRQVIPDRLSLTAGSLGLLAAVALPGGSLIGATLGGVTGLLLLLAVGHLGQLAFKKEAMGGGDIKMAAAIGVLLGWQGVVFSLFGGAVLALWFVGIRAAVSSGPLMQRVPFGPFVGVAAVVYALVGSMYLSLTGLWFH